jgi:hypothetical protein
MFRGMRVRLARTLTTKVGLALVGALVLGGGASAVAMATTHSQFFANGHLFSTSSGLSTSASPTKHAGEQDDQDDTACTSKGTPTSTSTPHGGGDDAVQAPKATPTKAIPTKAVGDDADEHEGTEHDGTECEGDDHSPKATHTPEPTEHPEGSHAPEPSPTKGPDGD